MIRTKRLLLREFQESDYLFCCALETSEFSL